MRNELIKLAMEHPELRRHIVPVLRESYHSKDAGFKDTLKKLWESYKKQHPKSEKPPKSLMDKAKGDGGQNDKASPKRHPLINHHEFHVPSWQEKEQREMMLDKGW